MCSLFNKPTRGLGTDHMGILCDGIAHAISAPLLPAGANTSLSQFAKDAGCPQNQWKEQLGDSEVKGQSVLSLALALLSQLECAYQSLPGTRCPPVSTLTSLHHQESHNSFKNRQQLDNDDTYL